MKSFLLSTSGKLALTGVALGALFPAISRAECGLSTMVRPTAAWPEVKLPQALAQSSAVSSIMREPASGEVASAAAQHPTIVGLWRVTFVSGGQTVDEGFDQWNTGGTEILNDTPPPATGNVCLGVWTQTGGFSYKLKHPSWTFDASGNLNGTVIIREQPVVAPNGNSFQGPFTLDAYDLSGNFLWHADGTITGRRITAD